MSEPNTKLELERYKAALELISKKSQEHFATAVAEAALAGWDARVQNISN